MTVRQTEKLRRDALQIWKAGLEAVRSERLIERSVRVERGWLHISDSSFDLRKIRRIAVVGAGKAGAGMVVGLENALGPHLLSEKLVAGWVNVPADCLRTTKAVRLYAARPAGANEPTEEGVIGAREILRLVESLGPDDLCLAMISGGGSALLPAPRAGISLTAKLAVTRLLSGAGANIEELNTVRKQLSAIKGGGLARACRAGTLVALIISDVPGDSLDNIASGPTVADRSTPADALQVLARYDTAHEIPAAVYDLLRRLPAVAAPSPDCRVVNSIIGNNRLAVDAAGAEAQRLGYQATIISAARPEGAAEAVGRHLAEMALRMRTVPGPDCLVSGGEPTVRLIEAAQRGRGGRNQQLVLSAMQRLAAAGATGIALVSCGTDGEDGPTDAAGALVDVATLAEAARCDLNLADYLRRNDAYTCLEQLRAIVKTGPTGTNVGDVRVVVVDRLQSATKP